MRFQLVVVALLAAALTACGSSSPSFVVRKDTGIGGFDLTRAATLKGAIDAYGPPTSREPFEGQACIVTWRDLGIRIDFFHAPSTTVCDGRGCHSETLLSNEKWTTDEGLHVGDTLDRLREVYPSAEPNVLGRWTILSRRFGVPSLLAVVRTGRITAFIVNSPWLLTC